MRTIKYLNAVLSIIAFCLLIITLAITGFIPTVRANNIPNRLGNIPVNSDGSITVKLANSSIVDVNLIEIAGEYSSGIFDINIKKVDGHPIHKSIPVEEIK